MKNIYTLAFLLLATSFVYAQVPQGISFQAIAFDGNNNPVSSSNVGVQISILQGSASGNPVYVETHTETTNSQGLFSLNIGQGIASTGIFSTLNWSIGNKWIKVEVDPNGGISYTTTSISKFMSVPFALIAEDVVNDKDEQTISLFANTLSISNGNNITLPNNNDNSSTNEIQTLSLNGNNLTISNGNSVAFSPNNDNSSNNEIQSLSINEDTIFISQSNYVVLPEIILESPNGTQFTLTVNDSGYFSTNLLCNPGVEQANAGNDLMNLQQTSVNLSANIPSNGTGQWSIISGSGGSFSNVNQFNSSFLGISGQTYILRWTISNACGSTNDDVSVSFSGTSLPSCQCQGQTLYVFPSNNGAAFWENPPTLIGQSAQSVNNGEQNTNAIISALGSTGTTQFRAPQICYNLNQYGYTDWYLPSKDELDCMYLNQVTLGNNFVSSYYWSSTEFSQNYTWVQHFSTGTQTTTSKNYGFTGNGLNVRCIRK